MSIKADFNSCESDALFYELMRDCDGTAIPTPNIDFEPHLLISKVRKHYMEYIIKLLSVNYESNQRLLNKNIYLPSAIWRCAKSIEMTAAQACMVVQLYRKNIVAVIKDLKNDTNKGKLYKKLYEYLHKPPENEKKTQATLGMADDCTCQCTCSQRKKRRRIIESSKQLQSATQTFKQFNEVLNGYTEQCIPETQITTTNYPQLLVIPSNEQSVQIQTMLSTPNATTNSPKPCARTTSVESQNSDELIVQLEKLFQSDSNDDDLFEGTLYETDDPVCAKNAKEIQNDNTSIVHNQDTVIENHSAQIKSLDERLASLTGLIVNNNDSSVQQKLDNLKCKKYRTSKWLCEEYFLKQQLFELLDQIRECNRLKLARVKEMLLDLFGDDSDDEGVLSPLDETPEFIISCKERIAPWVVKLLTPYYVKGRIKGKALFKALAKHLIRLIYQCSRYPHEYEVHSFVSDFLQNHKMIRCEADFKQFRIDNI